MKQTMCVGVPGGGGWATPVRACVPRARLGECACRAVCVCVCQCEYVYVRACVRVHTCA